MSINSVTSSYITQNYSNYKNNYKNNSVRTQTSSKAVKAPERNNSVNDYLSKIAQNNLVSDDKTAFPISSPIERLAQYTRVIYEHYAKENEDNMQFSNPTQHINDKYFNKNSSYYITGLTEREREICAESERRVLNGGQPAINSYDPIIQKTFGGGIKSETEWNEDVRNGMNDVINRLFKENEIIVPEGADLKLRVDPYEYKIHVSGVDESLARQIADILNKGKNGKYLYEHLYWCNPAKNGFEQPKQYLYDIAVQEKAVMWHLVNDLTGYDIRSLDNQNGIIYAPDGRKLWDVMTENYEKRVSNGEMSDILLQSFYEDYQNFAKEGWSQEDKRGLTIGYRNGSLYDIDTEYGYGPGQNKWLQDVKEKNKQYWEVYQKNREKAIQNGETNSRVSKSLFKENEQTAIGDFADSLLDKYRSNTTLLSQLTGDYASLINALFREGRGIPLTEEILSISRNASIQEFDVKV